MKQLCIIRHGKSDWGNPFLDDFDRPLNNMGHLDAKKIGTFLANNWIAEKIISSSAKRAINTAYLIATQLNYDKKDIVQTKTLYHASLEVLIKTIHSTDDDVNTLYIIGHNPGLSSLCGYLTDEYLELKTCCVAVLQSDLSSWKNWVRGVAILHQYVSPKGM